MTSAVHLMPSPALACAPPKQRWLSVVSHTDPRYGGLSTAVPRAGASVSATDRFDVSLAAFCVPGEHVWPESYDETHLSFWPVSRRQWWQTSSLRKQFHTAMREVDGVHIHGLWEASTAIASRTAISLGKPYVLSAHGMLEPWALANKRLKKMLYAALVERGIVARAACLHALTHAEARQYRAFGARCPIAVIPNAVQVPTQRSPELFLAAHPELREKRLVMFMSRLHRKKGLDLLVKAWAQVAKQYPDAHLVLAGPDSEDTQARLTAMCEALGIAGNVSFPGMLAEGMKWSALAAAECFVLPSYSEGLSMSVLEALAAGVPAIITSACNMPEVAKWGAGWEIEANAEALTGALEDLLARSPAQNRAMGEQGRRLIASRYEPDNVAHQMADLYAFVLNGTNPQEIELMTA